MKLGKWDGSEFMLWFGISVSVLSLILIIYGTFFGIRYTISHPKEQGPLINFVVEMIPIVVAPIASLPILFLCRVNVGLWSIPLTLFPVWFIFGSFDEALIMLFIPSIVNLMLWIPIFYMYAKRQ